MSEAVIYIPDEEWIEAENNIVPADKTLCVVLNAIGDRVPEIMQYRKADWLYEESDYFLDVSEKWRLDAYDCGEDWEPGFKTMKNIWYWKPLGLPQEDNQRILKEIESWFEEKDI